MMHLAVVPYQEGDPQDDNHYRVENHHTLGLTGSTVMINNEEREVRACTLPHGLKHRDWSASILVHLKPRRRANSDPTFQCKFIDDMHFLTHIKNMKTTDACLQFYNNDPYQGNPLPRNLLLAKMRRYAQKGWIAGRFHAKQREVMLSGKGLNVLNMMLAGEWPRHA